MMMFDNTVQFIVITEKEQYVVSVESEAIANSMKMMFRAMWTQAY